MNSPLKVSLENIIPLTEARDHFSQIVTEVQQDKLYVLTKGGKPAVAIIDVKYLESVTDGTVKPEHIENEILKDPTKVGRTPMIKHEPPSASANNSNNSSLVFPKTDAAVPAAPEPLPQPIKINFQPAGQSSVSPTPPTPTPPAPTPLTSEPANNSVPAIPTPPATNVPIVPPSSAPSSPPPVAPQPNTLTQIINGG